LAVRRRTSELESQALHQWAYQKLRKVTLLFVHLYCDALEYLFILKCVNIGLVAVEASATRTAVPSSTHVCAGVASSSEVTWQLLEQLASLCGLP